MTKLMEKVDLSMQMEMSMKVTGSTIRLKVVALTSIKMEHSTLETGKKIDNTATE